MSGAAAGRPAETGPLRVLHLITDLDIGGAERMLTRLTTERDGELKQEIVSMLPAAGPFAAQIAAAGCRVDCLGMARGALDPRAILRLLRIIRRFRPHVLQSWLYHADLLATIAGRLTGVPALLWNIRCSDMDFDAYAPSTGQLVRVLRHLSRIPLAIVANSQAGRDVHERLGYRPRRWEVIPNGFELPALDDVRRDGRALRAQLGIAADAPVIGLMARFDPMKDHATFLRAAAQLAARRPLVTFILAGRGVDPANPVLARSLADTALGGRLHLLGERPDSAAINGALDIACSSSAFGEGCPNAIGEAMAGGVPCVATDVGDSARLIGDTGRCVAPRDPDALAEAWDALLRAPAEERYRMGAAARRRIAAQFALPAVSARYRLLYRTLAGRIPAAAEADTAGG